jgi:hypothetical protein
VKLVSASTLILWGHCFCCAAFGVMADASASLTNLLSAMITAVVFIAVVFDYFVILVVLVNFEPTVVCAVSLLFTNITVLGPVIVIVAVMILIVVVVVVMSIVIAVVLVSAAAIAVLAHLCGWVC